MKSLISSAVFTTAIVACLTLGAQAKPANHVSSSIITLSDTGKMAKNKMSADKMGKKKMNKMSADKMSKKKMAKDTSGKM